MLALLDANVYISLLLTQNPASPPRLVVEAARDTLHELLITAGVIGEVRHKEVTEPYPANRITQAEVLRFIRAPLVIAEILPTPDEPLPDIGRDR